jgi:hypothetical protein
LGVGTNVFLYSSSHPNDDRNEEQGIELNFGSQLVNIVLVFVSHYATLERVDISTATTKTTTIKLFSLKQIRVGWT